VTTASKGGPGNDVLLGGEGNDLLAGGQGRDLLFGGRGRDRLVGDASDDILISGTTDDDASSTALWQIMDEWTRSDASFAARVAHLEGTDADGKNGASYLNDQTGPDDGSEDVLTGNAGDDWFLFNQDGDGDPAKRDRVTDLTAFEAMFALDIDFINGV
jgi:Ca2+-binding RTX toxin-like protein